MLAWRASLARLLIVIVADPLVARVVVVADPLIVRRLA
jgi:hypothetical protein